MSSEDDDLYGPAPTQVTMITEDTFPFVTTTESHYAKEDTETMQVPCGPCSRVSGLRCVWKSSILTDQTEGEASLMVNSLTPGPV